MLRFSHIQWTHDEVAKEVSEKRDTIVAIRARIAGAEREVERLQSELDNLTRLHAELGVLIEKRGLGAHPSALSEPGKVERADA